MTGGQVVDITECSINFFRLLLLLVNGGKDVLSKLFTSRMTPNTTVDNFLQCYQRKLTELKNKRKILPSQWSLLFPVAKPDEWDISLWCLLLANICGISHPKDWNSQPAVADVSLEADLVRLRLFRNDICHAAEVKADSVTFQAVWKDVSTVLLRLTDHDQQYQKTFEKTIETYKEGPLPTFSHQEILLLELRKWQWKEGMEEISGIKSELSELVTQLHSNVPVLQPLLNTCNSIVKKIDGLPTLEQIDRKMEMYGVKWSQKTTEIVKDLNQMVERSGRKIERHMKRTLVARRTVNTTYDGVKGRFFSLSKRIRDFKTNYGENMKLLFEMVEKQVKLTNTALGNQEKMMMNQEQIIQQQKADHSETRSMFRDIMKELACIKGKNGDTKQKRGERRAGRTTEVVMDCNHRFEKNDLEDYLQHLLHLGHTSLTCYKKACRTEWCISELRSKLQWEYQTNRFYEETLSQNYIAKEDIKECPSCRSYCTRQDDRDIRVRCIVCRRFEFCWGCGQEWGSYNKHTTCGVARRCTAMPKRPQTPPSVQSVLKADFPGLSRSFTSSLHKSLSENAQSVKHFS